VSTGVARLVDFTCHVTTHASVEWSMHDFGYIRKVGTTSTLGHVPTCPGE
jgi:hypothetical protein